MDDCTWIYRDQLGVDPLQEDYLRKGVDHGVYVDDMKHVPTSDSIMQAREFLAEYSSESVSPRDCKIILGTEKLDSFCCLRYQQSHRGITIHRDACIGASPRLRAGLNLRDRNRLRNPFKMVMSKQLLMLLDTDLAYILTQTDVDISPV